MPEHILGIEADRSVGLPSSGGNSTNHEGSCVTHDNFKTSIGNRTSIVEKGMILGSFDDDHRQR